MNSTIGFSICTQIFLSFIHIYQEVAASHKGDSLDATDFNDFKLGDIECLERIGHLKRISAHPCAADIKYRLSDLVSREYINSKAQCLGFSLEAIAGLR